MVVQIVIMNIAKIVFIISISKVINYFTIFTLRVKINKVVMYI